MTAFNTDEKMARNKLNACGLNGKAPKMPKIFLKIITLKNTFYFNDR